MTDFKQGESRMQNKKRKVKDIVLVLCLAAGGMCFLLTQCHINYNKDRKLMRSIACASQLKQIGIALQEYAREQGAYPFPDGAAGLNLLNTRQYPEWQKIFICPNSSLLPAQGESLDEEHCSYHYFSGCDPKKFALKDILVIERAGNHENYFNVLFADGTASGVIPDAKNAGLEDVLRESYRNDFSAPFRKRQLEAARKWDREAREKKRKKD